MDRYILQMSKLCGVINATATTTASVPILSPQTP